MDEGFIVMETILPQADNAPQIVIQRAEWMSTGIFLYPPQNFGQVLGTDIGQEHVFGRFAGRIGA